MCSLHDGTEHAVDSIQDHREKENAETESERTEQRIDVDRLGTGKRLPYPECHIEESTQARNSLGNGNHVAAHGHHLRIKRTEHLMQIVKFRSHDYQYLSLSVPYRSSTLSVSFFALALR